MKIFNFLKHNWSILLVLIFTLIILYRIFQPGFFAVHDDTQPSRIFEMTKSLKDGMIPVRWVQDLGFGYGYPIFNFYAPLPYYIGALFNILGFDAITSAKLMYTFAVTLAGIGMYLFIRSFLGVLPALASAVIYLFFPYFALNIFIRGAVGEYFAYAILPFIFWSLFKIYYENTNNAKYEISIRSLINKWVLIASVSLAALISSHNLSAYMLILTLFFFLFAGLYFIKLKKLLFLQLTIALLLSFLLSAFYTIPALVEMNYTDVNSQLSGNFNYKNHFVCPAQWWDSPWGFAGSAIGCTDGMSFRLGKSNIILTILGIIFSLYIILIKNKKKYSFLFLFSLFVLLFSLFMMTEYSGIIWSNVPKIAFLQFPWRFLNLTGFAMSIIVGFLIFTLNQFNKKISIILLILIIISTVSLNAKLFTPQRYYSLTSSYYTDKENLNFTISKITNEYMPKNFLKPSSKEQIPLSPVDITKGTGTITLMENKTNSLQAKINMDNAGQIHINKAHFPAWHIYLDYNEISYRILNKGLLINIPDGNHLLSIKFIQTPIEKIANILSLTGVILLIIGIIISKKKVSYAKKTY